ncbi:MAG: GNAT family N-acetyltransferase [Candidatus Thorarchaeota archaeon]|nr:GNAT family N-acetyltransferase [Candidatus Thorarchaeota archaeon]
MHVRQYEVGDESSIALIHNSAFRYAIESLPEIYQYKEVSAGDILDWLQECTDLWVAVSENRIIGYAQVYVIVEQGKREIPVLQIISSRKWTLEQSNIAILPEYQRRGFGTTLVEEIVERYKDTIEFVTVHTFSDNLAAEQFFEKNGFTKHDVYYAAEYSDDKPLMNSSVYETLELENLHAPANLNPDIIFRLATLDDAEAVTEIHRQNVWWSEESNSLEWNKDFIVGKFGHTVFVAEYEGAVVGSIDYYKDERVGIAGVLPHMKGKGIGSAMFYKILLAMKEAGFKFAFMDSGMTQVDAIKMYERFGFTIQRKQNAWIKKIE